MRKTAKKAPETPMIVKFNGLIYWATGKTGTHTRTGEASTEYKYDDGSRDLRAWLRLPSGVIESE